jgi:Undecaprenyl-phosphate galactose phosphotransferase WbaP
VLLILCAPVFAAIAVLVRWGSEGPVLYTQQRMGTGGESFTALKFRTMYQDADRVLSDVLARSPQRREEYEQFHKLENDPRITSIGRILRRFSLDELPQLINVLRGDMSLVGPRPYMVAERSKMEGLDHIILQVRPGLTGLWQVSGRNDLSFAERIRLDVHYIQNWSPWLDVYIVVRTLPAVLTGEGAT